MEKILISILLLTFARESFPARIAVVDTNFDTESQSLANAVSYSLNLATNDNNVFWDPKFGSEDLYLIERFFQLSSLIDQGETLNIEDLEFLGKVARDQITMHLLGKFVHFSHGTHVASLAVKNSSHDLVLIKFDLMALYYRVDSDHERSILNQNIEPRLKARKYIQARFNFLFEIGSILREQGAQLANFSWGLDYFSLRDKFCSSEMDQLGICNYYFEELSHYLNTFFDHFSEIVFVIAAGNGNTNLDKYPSLFSMNKNENIIRVGAIDYKNEKAVFSNYGRSVDIYCPGVAISSFVFGDNTLPMSGTSMAAPYAANFIGVMVDSGHHSRSELIKEILASTSCSSLSAISVEK
jgi:subtilisin family serine protease